MKQQQLFNSFWLASTTVVLATQLAWADIVQVSSAQSTSTASSAVSLETPKTTTSNNNLDLEQFTSPTPISPEFPASADSNSRTTKTQAPSPNLQQSSFEPTVSNTEENLETPNTTNSGLAISQNILDLEQFTSPTPISPEFPAPAGSNTRSEENEAPSYLNPSPNPLQFPTKPQEVQVQGTQPITLQQAFDLARRNNRQLQIATLTLERSRAVVREAQAALYPNLSANTDVTRQRGAVTGDTQLDIENQQAQQREQLNQLDPEQLNQLNQRRASVGLAPLDPNQFDSDRSDSNAPSTNLNGTLQLSYDVYTSGERSGRIRASEEQLRIDQLDVERIAEQLRLDVSNDYYDLQQADEQVRINSAAVTNAEASLRDAQALEQAGVGTRFDVLRFQVNLANASQNLTNSLSDREIARRQLATRLSLAQSVSVTAADPVEIAGLWNIPLQDSIVLAFQNRAELQQELAQRNISEQQRRIALSTIRPRISLVSSYNVLDSFDDAGGLADGYSLGARLTWNLFDGGAAKARADQEEANKTISETRFADSRNNIRLQVESAYADLQSNLENIQTASVALEQAREALRLARLRFQAGVGTQTDVIAAENDLTQAEGNRVRAILDYNRALANLQRAISSGQPR